MAIRIKFKQKVFGSKRADVIRFIKTPQGIISSATLGVTSANLATNMRRHQNDKVYQEKQIDAMSNLTKSITGLDKTVKRSEIDDRKIISFRPKKLLQK